MIKATSRDVLVAITGGKSWPDDVRLYQPYEVDQILMNEFANCLSVKTFLNMFGLKYQIELRSNAEHMSPSGTLPFLQLGSNLITGFDAIVAFINLKGHSLTVNLTPSEMADLKTFINLVQAILETALLYVMWADGTAYQMVTKIRYGYPYTWPLKVLVPWKKRKEVLAYLGLMGWGVKTIEEVFCSLISIMFNLQHDFNKYLNQVHKEVGECYKILSNKPTELDALVFGYLYTILTTPLPENFMAEKIKEFENLTEFCRRIHDEYFVDR